MSSDRYEKLQIHENSRSKGFVNRIPSCRVGAFKTSALQARVMFNAVLQIHDILVRVGIRGSIIPLTNGFGSDPAISFFVYYFLKLHLHNFSKMKSRKEQEVWRFFLNIFAWWLKEPDPDKDPDPGGPKNTDPDPQHCCLVYTIYTCQQCILFFVHLEIHTCTNYKYKIWVSIQNLRIFRTKCLRVFFVSYFTDLVKSIDRFKYFKTTTYKRCRARNSSIVNS